VNNTTSERLYNLLPAIYRIRDEAQGGPLRALLSVIEGELHAIEADIEDLYNNEFIETCAEWVAPYIGDLLGVHGLHPINSEAYSLRPYVANTLAYRRRKGTAAVLEQLAKDVTGWRGGVVEFFQLLATTQHLNHLRPGNLRTPDLRKTDQLELSGSPFERATYTADVRRIAKARGKYNIPNIGLFLWRLQSYPVVLSTARAVTTPPLGRYRFNPLGYDIPLFNNPRTETDITHLAKEINVPCRLRRRPLYDELEACRQDLAIGKTPQKVYFNDDQPVVQVVINGRQVPPEDILIGDLSDLPTPNPTDWRRPPKSNQVAIDPALGRLAFPADVVLPGKVQVSYAYGFSSDVGGGPYDRQRSVEQWYDPLNRPVTFQIGVTQNLKTLNEAPDGTQLVKTLQEAVWGWNTHIGKNRNAFGLITIMDSDTYHENLTYQCKIEIPAGCKLAIVAADWPLVDDPDIAGNKERRFGQLTPDGFRPHLHGNISVIGTNASDTSDPGELVLDGLLIEGTVRVLKGNLGSLRLAHCTLAPDKGGLKVKASAVDAGKHNDNLHIIVDRSICGPIELNESEAKLWVVDSIIYNPGKTAIFAANSAVDLQTSTVFGESKVCSLEAGNSIFNETVRVERRQIGCVRFSFVPYGSLTPRCFRCQPALEIKTQIEAAEKSNPALTQAERDMITAKIVKCLVPVFTSTDYGQPAYGQLHLVCPEQIRTGAEDGSEMGVFSHLKEPQREANLHAAIEEYLRFGLETGIFYVA
jgi:hypothetical protein